MKKTLLSILILVLIQSAALAQDSFSVSFGSFHPTGDFRSDSPGLWGGGLQFEYLLQIKESPIHLGLLANFNIYGREKEGVRLNPGDPQLTEQVRSNYLNNYMLKFRYKPQNEMRIKPFVEVVGGFTDIYTQASVHNANGDCPGERVLSNQSLTFGLGGGLEYQISQEISLDLSVQAIQGSNVDYLTPSNLEYNQTDQTYNMTVRNSQLEFMMVNIGVRFPL